MQESPAIWQPQRRDLESFFFFFFIFSPLLLLCLQMERGLFLLFYWISEFAVTRGPGEDHIDLSRMLRPSRLLTRRLVYGNHSAHLAFWEKPTFFKRHGECGESGGDLRITKCWDGRRRLWLAVSYRSMKSYFTGVRSPRVKLCCLGISLHAFGEIL